MGFGVMALDFKTSWGDLLGITNGGAIRTPHYPATTLWMASSDYISLDTLYEIAKYHQSEDVRQALLKNEVIPVEVRTEWALLWGLI